MRYRLAALRWLLGLLPPSAHELGQTLRAELRDRAVAGRLRAVPHEAVDLFRLATWEWRHVAERRVAPLVGQCFGAAQRVIAHSRGEWLGRGLPAATVAAAVAMAAWTAAILAGHQRDPGGTDPNALTFVWGSGLDEWGSVAGLSGPELSDIAELPEVAGVIGFSATSALVTTPQGRSVRPAARVVGELDGVLGTTWALGRAPIADGNEMAVSWKSWTTDFGGRPDAIGMLNEIDGTALRLVGVLPPGMHLRQPGGGPTPAIVIPIHHDVRTHHWLTGVVRRASGVTHSRLESSLEALAGRTRRAHPHAYRTTWQFASRPVVSPFIVDAGPLRRLSLGAALLVVLAVLAASQTPLGRLRSGSADRVVRALGATPRMCGIERGTYVALIAGSVTVVAAMLAWVALRSGNIFWASRWPELAGVDPHVGWALAVAVVGGGFLATTLVAEGRRRDGSSPGDLTLPHRVAFRRGPRARLATLGASCVVILGVAVEAATQFRALDRGRSTAPDLTLATVRADATTAADTRSVADTLLQRVAALPDSHHVAVADSRLFHQGRWGTVRPHDDAVPPGAPSISASVTQATRGFVEVTRARILSGSPTPWSRDAALVDSTFAVQAWGDTHSAIGKSISIPRAGATAPAYRVIGVVAGPRPPPAITRDPPARVIVPFGTWETGELTVYVDSGDEAVARRLEEIAATLGIVSTETETLGLMWTLRGGPVRNAALLFGIQSAMALAVAILFVVAALREACRERRRALALELTLGLSPRRLRGRLVAALVIPGAIAGILVIATAWLAVPVASAAVPVAPAPLFAGLLIYLGANLIGAALGMVPIVPTDLSTALRSEHG